MRHWLISYLSKVAIDLTLLAEAIPQEWSFILSSLAGIWGLGNAVTGLIGKYPNASLPHLLIFHSLAAPC